MSDQRASDDLLIQLVREGRHDAEVAVRLGITTGELRERKATLRHRLGDHRYNQVTGAAPASRRSRSRRRLLLWAAVGAASVLAGLLVIANLVVGGDEGGATSPAPLAPPVAGDRAPPTPVPVVEDGIQFEDFGPFLLPGGSGSGAVGQVDNRTGLATVQLKGTSFVTSSASVEWSVVTFGPTFARLMGVVAGRRVDIVVQAEDPRTRMRRILGAGGPILEVSVPDSSRLPTLLLRGLVAADGRPLEVRLTREGRLLVAREPVPREWALDEPSGARIDLAAAHDFGVLSIGTGAWTFNICEGGPPAPHPAHETVVCRVSWRRAGRGFEAPMEGVFSCVGSRTLRYEASGVRMDFELAPSTGGTPDFRCDPEPVPAGHLVVPDGDWIISASDMDGESLSVAVTGEGRVYLGPMKGDVDCPCAPGS